MAVGAGVTLAEFEQAYAERSGVTVAYLHENGRRGEPCACGDESCEGWQMAHVERELSGGDVPEIQDAQDVLIALIRLEEQTPRKLMPPEIIGKIDAMRCPSMSGNVRCIGLRDHDGSPNNGHWATVENGDLLSWCSTEAP